MGKDLQDAKNTRGMQEWASYNSHDFPVALFTDDFDAFLGNSYDLHWHDEVELLVVLEGRVKYFLNQEVAEVKAGDGVFIGSRVMHAAKQQEKGTRAFNILFPLKILSQMLNNATFHKYTLRSTGWTNVIYLLHGAVSEENEILNGLMHIMASVDEEDAELVQAEQILHIWRYLLKALQKNVEVRPIQLSMREERMRLMVSYIQENYSFPLSAADIASAANLTPPEQNLTPPEQNSPLTHPFSLCYTVLANRETVFFFIRKNPRYKNTELTKERWKSCA